MKQLLLLGVMIMLVVGLVSAHDSTATPNAPTTGYVVNLSTDPQIVAANKSFTLTVSILDTDGKTPIKEFDEVHTKLLHFILVSEDLTQFLHVHPDYQGDGVFVLKDLVLPVASNYVTFADFTPTGDQQRFVRNTLAVSNALTKQPDLAVSPTEITIDDLKMQLVNAEAFKAGTETTLKFHVSDAATGAAVDTLDEYLGAAGHLVIIDQTSQIYIHTHPAGHDMETMNGMAGMEMPTQFGPDLEFATVFPSAGLWAMWLQVQYKEKIYTFPYVVEVTGTPEGTPEAHAHG